MINYYLILSFTHNIIQSQENQYDYYEPKNVVHDLDQYAKKLGPNKSILYINTGNISKLKISLKSGEAGVLGLTYLDRAKNQRSFSTRLEVLNKLKCIAGYNPNLIHDQEFEKLRSLNVQEIIGLFKDDPLKLQMYLQFAYLEMSVDEANKIVLTSFKGIYGRTSITKEDKYLADFEVALDGVEFESSIPRDTDKNLILVEGVAGEATHVMVAGSWTQRIKVENNRYSISLPLKTGATNEFRFMFLDVEKKVRSAQVFVFINQTGEADDVKALVMLLSNLKDEARKEITKDSQRMAYLIACTKQMLIKKFAYSFDDGKQYVNNLIREAGSEMMEMVLKTIVRDFEAIDAMEISNFIPETSLKFFQKFIYVETRKRIEAGEPGVIHASEPGLGKTITALACVNGDAATIVSPNAVVSTWQEEAQKFLRKVDLMKLQNIDAVERKKRLRNNLPNHVVTNIEFLRGLKDEERFDLLSGDGKRILVYDEAHSLANPSQQTKGAAKIERSFLLLLSASPFKNPTAAGRILRQFYPDDKRYASDAAFRKAFPIDNPEALKTLNLILQKLVIRFRKQDVLDEFDRNIPLNNQSGKLPIKEYISSNEIGEFTMTNAQAWAIYEMFVDWPAWCKKYDKYIPEDKVSKLDGLRTNNGLTKKHALRQTVNNLDYIGIDSETSPKHEVMQKIVERCRKENRKIVIFCRYNAQADVYAEMFKELNPALYTGVKSKENFVKDSKGKKLLFVVDDNKKIVLDYNGKPIVTTDKNIGEPILPLDYERLKFQNQKSCRMMISTYSAGSVGVTFMAGKAMINDDLPEHYTEQYQADDRIHRMDDDYKSHYEVKYFKMISKYPEEFLEETKKTHIRKNEDGTYEEVADKNTIKEEELESAYDLFFAQGTFDEVQARNLNSQKQIFRLIHDGIADEDLIEEDNEQLIGMI